MSGGCIRLASAIALGLSACAQHGFAPAPRLPPRAAARAATAPPPPATPPPLFLLDVRPGFSAAGQPSSGARADVKTWFENAVGGIAAARFIRPISAGGRTLVSDGVAYGRISNDLLIWSPELSCGLDPVNRSWTFWGRDPDLFTIQHNGFARFDSGRHSWVNVGPDPASWPGNLPTVTEMPDGRTLLVLWLPRLTTVLIGTPAVTERARPLPPRLPPGFYQLTGSLTPVALEIRDELRNQMVVDLKVTTAGDVVLLSTAGADIWRVGQTRSVSAPVLAQVLVEPFPETKNWIDVDGSRRPEVIHRAPGDRSAITRFDGQRWADVTMPLSGSISAWARDGSARLYAENTPSGARIWRRTADDRWSRVDDLADGSVKTLGRDASGAIWAFVPSRVLPTGELWYLPRPGQHVRVRLPGEQAAYGVSALALSDSIVWVTAIGNDFTMEIFATRKFRQSGVRVGPNDDACSGKLLESNNSTPLGTDAVGPGGASDG